MATKLIYLATEFMHRSAIKRQRNLQLATAFTAELVQRGVSVFSPVAHRGMVATHAEGLETKGLLFRSIERPIMEAAAGVLVVGRADEMDVLAAQALKKNVIYTDWTADMDSLALTLRGIYGVEEVPA